MVICSFYEIPRIWYLVFGIWYLLPGTRNSVLGDLFILWNTWNSIFITRNSAHWAMPGARNSIPRTQYLVSSILDTWIPDTQNAEFRIWCLTLCWLPSAELRVPETQTPNPESQHSAFGTWHSTRDTFHSEHPEYQVPNLPTAEYLVPRSGSRGSGFGDSELASIQDISDITFLSVCVVVPDLGFWDSVSSTMYWVLRPKSRVPNPGLRNQGLGSMGVCTLHNEFRNYWSSHWNSILGVWNLVLNTWNSILSTRNLVLNARNSVLGIWYLLPGCPDFGIEGSGDSEDQIREPWMMLAVKDVLSSIAQWNTTWLEVCWI
jgi:hypothetical protein